MGKSRLVYEFTHSHRLQGWLVLESGSVSYGKATSYLPVIDLLKGYFEIQDRDDLARDPREGDGQAARAGPGARSRRCRRCWPCSTCRWTMPQWQALDPPQRRQRTLDAVKRLLLRESQEQPLSGLRGPALDRRRDPGVARRPGREPASARLLLLVNYRPEYQHGWGSKTYYSQLRLDPLAGRERRGAARRAPRRRSRAGAAQAAPRQARATRSSWRRPSGRWWRRGAGGRARARIG